MPWSSGRNGNSRHRTILQGAEVCRWAGTLGRPRALCLGEGPQGKGLVGSTTKALLLV